MAGDDADRARGCAGVRAFNDAEPATEVVTDEPRASLLRGLAEAAAGNVRSLPGLLDNIDPDEVDDA